MCARRVSVTRRASFQFRTRTFAFSRSPQSFFDSFLTAVLHIHETFLAAFWDTFYFLVTHELFPFAHMVCVHAILVILVPFSPFQKKFVFLQKVLHAMKGKFTKSYRKNSFFVKLNTGKSFDFRSQKTVPFTKVGLK